MLVDVNRWLDSNDHLFRDVEDLELFDKLTDQTEENERGEDNDSLLSNEYGRG